MAHRIYLYNYDQETNQTFESYLGEWNYEIPLLLYPLMAEDTKLQGTEILSNREQGIKQLRNFFNLLADTYQLQENRDYNEASYKMFEFLEALPYDSFLINAFDVFNMNEEKHKIQAKEWLLDIQQKSLAYKHACESQDLSVLNSLFTIYGYRSFHDIINTDWINYGLGYFEEQAYKTLASSTFEENGKFGLKDVKGNILAPAIYDEIFEADPNYGISVMLNDSLFGYLQSDGKEVVPAIYEDALDVFDFAKEPLAEIKANGKWGILKVHSNTWMIEPKYDMIERVAYGYFGLEKDGKYSLFSDEDGLISPIDSENRYEYDFNSELFFTKQVGTSKRKYYSKKGTYIGDFIEGTVIKASTCYWIKPNKLNKKGTLIDESGNIVLSEVDQLLSLDDFETLAMRKANVWKIYQPLHHRFLLEDEQVLKLKAESSSVHKNDSYMLETEGGLGLYDASAMLWLIPPSQEIKKIHYLENGFLTIERAGDYQLFDFDYGRYPASYNYISNPLNYRTEEGLLFLYTSDLMWRMLQDKRIQRVDVAEYGSLYLDRYSFRGKDLEYFISFYNRWKQQAGDNPEQYMDVETIKKMAYDARESQRYDEALRLFSISAQKNDMDSYTEIGALLTDPELVSLFDPQRGISHYEYAAKHDHAVAWNNIGALYHNGIGYPFSINKAIEAYKKGAELGDGMALVNLGTLYYFGEHVPQNYDLALEYFQKAEKLRYYNYDKISEIYYQQRDYKNLLQYLKKDYEETFSAIYYGIIYEHGMGVTADLKKAIKYYEQANAYAAYEYATQRLLYYYGEDLTLKNEKKYRKWKSFAEEQEFEIDA